MKCVVAKDYPGDGWSLSHAFIQVGREGNVLLFCYSKKEECMSLTMLLLHFSVRMSLRGAVNRN